MHNTLDSPALKLSRLVAGAWIPHAVHTATALGIVDAMAEGALSACEIARRIHGNHGGVHRLLRALTSIGICQALQDDRFELTAMGDCLRSDSLYSLRSWALLMGADEMSHSWNGLTQSVQTGGVAGNLPDAFDPFQYLVEQRPEYAETFYAAMAEMTHLMATAVTTTYDFNPFNCIIDVGGGNGALLTSILKASPDARGILFDFSHRRDIASAIAKREGVYNRWTFEAGSFFEAVPSGGDIYLLKSVLHDWDDENGECILKACRATMTERARLLVIEMVIRDPARESAREAMIFGTDLSLLATLRGRERTLDDFRWLLGTAGFRISRVLETASAFDLIEAAPA